MSDITTNEPPRAHARIVYLGPVAPHWEVYGDYGDRALLDEFRTGDRIRCLLLEIREDPQRGREFVLSRANEGFVRRLLELEVAEIADKTVTIAKMARDPGYRTKIAVDSSDPKVDPVGACVGARGARVRNIVKELGGEKIDIIRYHKEPLKLLEEAIRPARPRNVRIDERNRSIHFEVEEEDMRIAIGSKGRNARLTSKLMGWGLNIAKAIHAPESVEAQLGERASRMAEQLGLPFDLVAKFVQFGLTELSAAASVTAEELQDSGIPAEEVEAVLAASAKARRACPEPPHRHSTPDDHMTEKKKSEAKKPAATQRFSDVAKELGIEVKPGYGAGKIATELFERLCEDQLVQPTFVYDFPTDRPVTVIARTAGFATVADRVAPPFDDTHAAGSLHPGAPVIPAIIAAPARTSPTAASW